MMLKTVCLLALSFAVMPLGKAVPPDWPPPAPDDGYVLGTPGFLAGAGLIATAWSPDGRYAVAARTVPGSPSSVMDTLFGNRPAEQSVCLWNAVTRTATVVWRHTLTIGDGPDHGTRIDTPQWLPGSHTAFFEVANASPGNGAGNTLWRVDARRATAQEVTPLNPGEEVAVSPTHAAAFIVGANEQGPYLKPLSVNGGVGSPIPLGTGIFMGYSVWSPDGATLYVYALQPHDPAPASAPSLPAETGADNTGGGGPTRFVYAYDTRGSTAQRLDVPPRFPTAPKTGDFLRVISSDAALKGSDAGETAHPLWLEEGEGKKAVRFLITADGTGAQISPRSDAVLYQTGEGAFVVPVYRVPRAYLDRMKERAEQSKALNNARQIAIAAAAYAEAHGDTLPGPGGDLQAQLSPYLKSADVFSSPGGPFTYTFQGGPLGAVENPAATLLGYTPVANGYAAAYMDGHVKWLKTLPSTTPQ